MNQSKQIIIHGGQVSPAATRLARRQPSRRVWLAAVRPETAALIAETGALLASPDPWAEVLADPAFRAALEAEVTTWGLYPAPARSRPAYLHLVKGGGTR